MELTWRKGGVNEHQLDYSNNKASLHAYATRNSNPVENEIKNKNDLLGELLMLLPLSFTLVMQRYVELEPTASSIILTAFAGAVNQMCVGGNS